MKKLNKRRRQEGRTNYHKRLTLLKSKVPRLVVRKSNKYIILQIVESSMARDKVLQTASTKELLKHGWPENKKGSLKSLAAAYLAGLLIAKKTDTNKVILDSGLIPSTKGSRVYSAVKGVKEGGVDISVKEDMLPSDEMVNKYDFISKVREGLK